MVSHSLFSIALLDVSDITENRTTCFGTLVIFLLAKICNNASASWSLIPSNCKTLKQDSDN